MLKFFKTGGLGFRLATSAFMPVLYLADLLHIPPSLMPTRKMRGVRKYWTREMIANYMTSLGTKLPHDQLCVLKPPKGFRPKVADVAPENRMSDEDVEEFYRNGYVKPFDVFTPEEMTEFGRELLELREKPSTIYGFKADRDRHLEFPDMMRMMAHPAITDRLAQLLGPDLVAWRSQIFHKPPGNNPVGWHQASTYMFEEGFGEPTVFPPDLSELFMLTVWIPADPSTRQNGCLKIETGTAMEQIRWMRLGGSVGFHAVNYYPDYEVDESKVHYIEMTPGQAVIFAERTIHGSEANKTDRNRLAFNFRVVPSHVRVYHPGKKVHHSSQMAEDYDLSKWEPVLIRGTDPGVNNAVRWEKYGGEKRAAPVERELVGV